MGALLPRDGIRLGLRAADRFEAVRLSGQVLVEIGAVEAPYVDAMLERERQISTSLGEGFAIPHGTDESRRWIHETMLAFLQFPGGVAWDDGEVIVCVGIAAVGDEHVGVLANLARVLTVPEQAARLRSAERPEDVLSLLGSDEDTKQ
ncbi:MAG TPA: PTS sugar transporter subunit IIA [Actinomycetota bacterium]|jgi:mannitol/fructose-specific phosphotransferase system IIA component